MGGRLFMRGLAAIIHTINYTINCTIFHTDWMDVTAYVDGCHGRTHRGLRSDRSSDRPLPLCHHHDSHFNDHRYHCTTPTPTSRRTAGSLDIAVYR